jgi:hypothetical protein
MMAKAEQSRLLRMSRAAYALEPYPITLHKMDESR